MIVPGEAAPEGKRIAEHAVLVPGEAAMAVE